MTHHTPDLDRLNQPDTRQSDQKRSRTRMNASDYAPLLGGGALLLLGLSRQSIPGLLIATLGGAIVYRQLQKQDVLPKKRTSTQPTSSQLVELDETITVQQPIEEVFQFWSDFENFPRFMDHIQSVQKIDDQRSHWHAFIPFTNQTLAWHAEIVETRQNSLIRWRSAAYSDIYNEGTIRFKHLPNNAGTQIHAHICYRPPAGKIGQVAAQFLNNIPANFIRNDMERFRRLFDNSFPKPGIIDNDISF